MAPRQHLQASWRAHINAPTLVTDGWIRQTKSAWTKGKEIPISYPRPFHRLMAWITTQAHQKNSVSLHRKAKKLTKSPRLLEGIGQYSQPTCPAPKLMLGRSNQPSSNIFLAGDQYKITRCVLSKTPLTAKAQWTIVGKNGEKKTVFWEIIIATAKQDNLD